MSMVLVLFCALVSADLSGVWILKDEVPAGEQQSRLELPQNRDKLQGTATGHPPLEGRHRVEGKVKGARVQFDVIAEMDGFQFVRIYDGQLDENGVIRGTGRAKGVSRWKFTAQRE